MNTRHVASCWPHDATMRARKYDANTQNRTIGFLPHIESNEIRQEGEPVSQILKTTPRLAPATIGTTPAAQHEHRELIRKSVNPRHHAYS